MTMAAGALMLASRARAADGTAGEGESLEPRRWLSVAALLGSTQPDAKLADYQWKTSPSTGWGAQVMAGRGRGSAGVRFWSSDTRQSIDVPGASVQSAMVNEMTYEAVLAARVCTVAGFQLQPALSGGRLHLAYHPDQVAIPTGGPSGATMVQLGPIDEWQWGGGLALARRFAGEWSAGLGMDVRFYSLDTAHRNGSVIETGREGFEDWSLRFMVTRRIRIG
ncbi:MAG: hypothetical protein ACRENS_04135 [Candidatus Eiseniibacteriota bacterium]